MVLGIDESSVIGLIKSGHLLGEMTNGSYLIHKLALFSYAQRVARTIGLIPDTRYIKETDRENMHLLPLQPKTAEQVSRDLQGALAPKRILELAHAGYLPHLIIDGNVYFRTLEVEEWTADNLTTNVDGSDFPKAIPVQHVEACRLGIVPDSLLLFSKHLRRYNHNSHLPCVYFLVADESVVYVGKSTNLPQRIHTHTKNKEFDAVFFLPVPEPDLDDVEAAFIVELKPPLNAKRDGESYHLPKKKPDRSALDPFHAQSAANE